MSCKLTLYIDYMDIWATTKHIGEEGQVVRLNIWGELSSSPEGSVFLRL